jgi:hypothetical protein
MDVNIEEVTSRVQVADSQSLLDPRVLEQIVKMCIERMREEQAKQKRVQAERELRPNVSGHDQ